jgi:hypothetical protein
MQAALNLGGDPVGRLLGRVDRLGEPFALRAVAVVLHHRQEGARALDDPVAVLIEHLEEIALARQELGEHWFPSGIGSTERNGRDRRGGRL